MVNSEQIETIEYKTLKNHNSITTQAWIAQVALIELLYALQSEGAFNYGREPFKRNEWIISKNIQYELLPPNFP
jgi:predicted nucleic-acid-binding protein